MASYTRLNVPEQTNVSQLCYYPFGMVMQSGDRNWSISSYAYGFQNQLKDDELKGPGNSINFEFRMHDPRLGRFLSVDPLSGKFPYYSPYHFCSNNPIFAIDLEGLESSNDLNPTPYLAPDGSYFQAPGMSNVSRYEGITTSASQGGDPGNPIFHPSVRRGSVSSFDHTDANGATTTYAASYKGSVNSDGEQIWKFNGYVDSNGNSFKTEAVTGEAQVNIKVTSIEIADGILTATFEIYGAPNYLWDGKEFQLSASAPQGMPEYSVDLPPINKDQFSGVLTLSEGWNSDLRKELSGVNLEYNNTTVGVGPATMGIESLIIKKDNQKVGWAGKQSLGTGIGISIAPFNIEAGYSNKQDAVIEEPNSGDSLRAGKK